MNINDIGLKIFGWVKKAKGESVNLDLINNKVTDKMQHDEWDILLKKYVSDKGGVDYQGLLKDADALSKYLNDLTIHPPGKNWSEAEQLAYWINAYNAFTVKLILDNYPLKSIKDISDGLPMINSPWDIKFFKIGTIDFDLNTIEHDILRIQFKEPRIHFAINCASFSCPKLRNEAYTAAKLEFQLEEQTRAFINNPDKNIITKKRTKLSKIFDWFQSDFLKYSTLEDFLKKYNPAIKKENKLEYMDYNWTLNE